MTFVLVVTIMLLSALGFGFRSDPTFFYSLFDNGSYRDDTLNEFIALYVKPGNGIAKAEYERGNRAHSRIFVFYDNIGEIPTPLMEGTPFKGKSILLIQYDSRIHGARQC